MFTDAQLKLWMRRVQAEMSKGTAPQDTLDLVKQVMTAQSAGEEEKLPMSEAAQNQQAQQKSSR